MARYVVYFHPISVEVPDDFVEHQAPQFVKELAVIKAVGKIRHSENDLNMNLVEQIVKE
jgi:hypothetical protein